MVNDAKDGTAVLPGGAGTGNVGVCQLVNAVDGALGANEMSIMGEFNGQGILIAKLTNKIAVDFNGTRYKWSVVNDSTTSILSLTTP